MARVVLATLRGAGGFEKRLVVKQIRDELAMDQAFIHRLVDEAKMTVALSHPNIVPVYELGVEQGTYFIAMELVEGISLTELVGSGSSKRPVSPDEGAYVGIEVCRALDYAHRRMSVVHRDVTPRNVMIDEEGQVKVIDFGIAAPARAGGVEVFGSPGHMPPEQMRGEELGPEADIFAVAVLLMEAWSGQAVFRRATPEECEKAMKGPHPKPSDFDPRLAPLDDIMASALSLDPKARPKSAEDLGRAFRKFLSGIDLADIARELGERVRRKRSLMKPTPLGQPSRRRAPSVSDLETKTFAQREEVAKWKSTAPPPSEDDPKTPRGPKTPEGPSTRKIDDTPIETIATRPIETPVDGGKTVPRPRPSMLRYAPLAIVLLGGVGFFAWRAQHPQTTTTTSTTTTASTSAPPSVTTPPSSTTPPTTTTAPVIATTTIPTTSAPEVVQGHLALYGDPGTIVSIIGESGNRELGKVPINDLALPPGDYRVKFTFPETHESNEMPVHIRPADRVRIRADFTGTTPKITVER